MAETVAGGLYQDAAGNYHDANGKELTAAQVKAAKKALGQLAEDEETVPDPKQSTKGAK